MEKSVLEKSFAIRSEKRGRKRNLTLFIVFSALAIFSKIKPLCLSCSQYFVSSSNAQLLACDTIFKISAILSAYNLIVLIISKVFKTRMQVTEEQFTLLGIKGKDSSIDINPNEDLCANSEKLKPISSSSKDARATPIAEGFKSFQESWDEKNLNVSQGLSQLNISASGSKRMPNLADIIDKSFSFNFPFQNTFSKPAFISNLTSKPDQLYHSSTSAAQKGQTKPGLRKYIQGYFTPEKSEPKGSIFDKLDSVDDFKLTKQQKMKSVLRIRKWISRSILEHIDSEIKSINQYLKENGLYEYLIGKCSCSTLAKFSAQSGTSMKRISNLPNLIIFLELTSKQDYLVNRIHELAQDGSMGKYNHVGGSTSKEFKWNQSLPTDSEIIMHLFLTYMDVHYPDSLVNINKSFTSKYFNVADPSKMKKDEFSIYKEMLNVNYFSLVISGKHIKIERSNDNVFLVILHLVVFVKYCMGGYIGSLDLGKSGINILSVVE